MRTRSCAAVVGLALAAASCGQDRAPTSPGGPVVPVALAIAGAPGLLGVGETQRLVAVVTSSDGSSTPAPGPVTWRSSNEAVLATWTDGLVVAMSPGDAAVTAVAGNLTTSSTFVVAHRGGDFRRVEGRLLDFASGSGVGGATLLFRTAEDGISLDAGTATTDGLGAYAIALPTGDYQVTVDERAVAVLVIRVGSPAFRGDILTNGGACIARYGTVIDATTYRPLPGATVTYGGGTATTAADGTYRIDHPCVGSVNGNTITVGASHPDYVAGRRFSGRGLSSVVRLDFALQPR